MKSSLQTNTLLVVPMKSPHQAKTRLHGVIGYAERTRLARQLFENTLRTLTTLRKSERNPGYDIAVVTGSQSIADLARKMGTATIREREGAGLNAALADAARHAKQQGYDRICVLPADLAAPDPRDIGRFLHHELKMPGMAICPSRDFGTNALLLTPPDALEFAFGPDSFHAHVEAAIGAGIAPSILCMESLRWDIDSSDDLAELLEASPDYLRAGTGP